MESKVLGKSDFFNAAWPAPVRVDVPGHGHLFVRVLRAGEIDALQEASVSYEGGDPKPVFAHQRGRLVALCACDETGVRLFTDDDTAQLSDKPATLIGPVYEAAQKANGLTREAKDEAKKGTSPTPGSPSTTASP